MRKIICRFANQTDLDAFNKQNGLSLTKDVKEYDFRTNTAIYKRTGKLKGFDTSWKPIWTDMPDFVEPKVVDFAKIDFILMWQKTPCLYRREMNATSAEFTQVIEVDNRT